MNQEKRNPGSGVRGAEAPAGQLPPYLEPSENGCRIAVKVHPRARRERVAGAVGAALKLEVTAPPEHGAANEAVEALLARVLGVRPSQIRVVSGYTSRAKIVAVSGVRAADAARLLAG